MACSNKVTTPAGLRQEARWQKALWKMATHPAVAGGEFDQALEAICHLAAQALPAQKTLVLNATEYPWLAAKVASGPCACLAPTRPAARSLAERLLESLGLRSAAAAPVRPGPGIEAVFLLGTTARHRFTLRELDFTNDVAGQIAIAMLNARRRQTETELRNSEQLYRRFVEFTQEAVWHVLIDPPVLTSLPPMEQIQLLADRARVVHCNDAMARIRGVSSARELIGRPLRAIMGPLDQARINDMLGAIKAGYSVRDFEALYHFPGVGDRWVQRNMVGVVKDGYLTELWGAARDITERKRYEESLRQSEQRYRAFLSNSSQGIFRIEFAEPVALNLPMPSLLALLGGSGVLAECNEAFAGMQGVSSSAAICGKPVSELGLAPMISRALTPEFIQNGLRAEGVDNSLPDASGGTRWLRYEATGIAENGCLLRIWFTVTDVTERVLMQEQMRALSARRAAVLEQERTRIAREIHDDLGQQLTALKFDIAAQRSLSKSSKLELARSVDSAIQALRRIAADLRPPILDHFGLAAAAEWQAREFTKRTGIACECAAELGGPLPRELTTTVFRILQEALTNVARHSGANAARVEIVSSPGRLVLRVSDNGRGIRPEEGAGTGSLGLAGMRERAAELGGSVRISAAPRGKGTLVEAFFPLETAASGASHGG